MKAVIPLAILISAGATGVMVTKKRSPVLPPSAVAASRPETTVLRNPSSLPRLDKQQRTEMLQRLTQAQHQLASAPRNSQPEAAATVIGKLDKDYIRDQMQNLIPMIKECYENALLKNPQLSGKLVVNFSIVAEPDIGGLVTGSTIDAAESTISDAEMSECVQETMYGAKFPAPADGGEVKITYPFIFENRE